MRSNKKKMIFTAMAVFCLLWLTAGRGDSGLQNDELRRNGPGEGEREEILEAEAEGKKYEIKVRVEERALTEKEAKKYLKAAKREVEHTFLGENASLNRIDKPVVMKSVYQEGLVEAQWELDHYEILDTKGNFVKTKIPPEGKVLSARVLLSIGKFREEYCFSFHVYSPIRTMREKIEDALEEEEAKNREKEVWELPQEAGGKEIRWRKKPSRTIWLLLLLGGISAVLLKFRGIEEERRQKQKRETELSLFYPQLVTTLSLLLGAGMSVSKAWERMVLRYKSETPFKKNAALDEMYHTYNEIKDGAGERKAYENFGKRCGLPQYRKLASLLTQNLRKGSAEITELLEKEAETAQNQRKNLAKKLGEEAGTKMLLPMLMMLAIVMAIVLVPAILSF